jgi:pyruvate/2-oxoglutarate dehydrogenase complex dihydrolipoamide acyltransferase (E2) component
MKPIKTVRVQPWGKGQGDFVEINESDFNPEVHKLFDGVVPMAPPPPAAITTDNVRIVEKARQLAEDAGVDISTIVGTGLHGKITIKDVELAIETMSGE